MHAVELINTVKWLEDLYTDETRKYLFEGGLVDLLTDSTVSERPVLLITAKESTLRVKEITLMDSKSFGVF